MKSRHFVVGLAVAAVALYFTFRDISLKEMLLSVGRVRYEYVAGFLVLFSASFAVRALRWGCFCRVVKPVPTARLFSPMVIGFMGNLLPLRAGEFIRAYLLGKREGMSFSASLGTIAVERLFDMLSVLALFGLLLAWNPSVLVPRGGEGETARVAQYLRAFGFVSLAGVLGLAGFFYLLVHRQERAMAFVRFFTRRLPAKVETRTDSILASFVSGLGVLKDPRGIVVSVLLSGLLWALLCLSNYPFYWAYGIQSQMPLDSVVPLMVVTCVLLSVMPTPGYLGPYQFGMTFVLADLYGVDRSVAAGFSMVNWFVTMGTVFLAGIFFLVRDNLSLGDLLRRAREVSRTARGAGEGRPRGRS